MDRFSALTAFAQVVEDGGFAAAARTLGQSRSQVNRQVIALEDRLGVSLLSRTTRAVTLTPTGRAFYERSKAILNDLAEAEQAIQDDHEEPQGDIKINAPLSFGTLHLGPALPDFMTRYPRIRVQLLLTDRFVDPVSEGFDITVRIAQPAETLALIEHPIAEIGRILCAAPSFLERHGIPKTLDDLTRLPCLHYGNLPTGAFWRLDGPEGRRDVRVNGVLCADNGEVLRDAAIAGMGIALIPRFSAGPALEDGRLVTVLDDYAAPELVLSLLYPPNRHLSARIRLFVDFMHQRFGDRPTWGSVS